MRPTCELRFERRIIPFINDIGIQFGHNEKFILQQKWEEYQWGPSEQERAENKFEWRDVPVVEESK